jgi:hypothetical protein
MLNRLLDGTDPDIDHDPRPRRDHPPDPAARAAAR